MVQNKLRIGKTELYVAKIGLGTWQAGFKDWGTNYKKIDVINAIKAGINKGINLIDTAELYGNGVSESIVGEAIYDVRDKVVVATKVKGENLHYDAIIKAANASLKRLKLKEIDLYQIHYPKFMADLKNSMRAMEYLVKAGKIRYIGVSNFPIPWIKKAQEAMSREEIVSNQIRYNLLQRAAETALIPYCKNNNITIIAWSPLAKGLLTGKYNAQNLIVYKSRKMDGLFKKANIQKLNTLITLLEKIATLRQKSIVQVALNWVVRKNAIPIPGVKNVNQALDNAGALAWELSDLELELIDSQVKDLKMHENIYSKLINWFYNRT